MQTGLSILQKEFAINPNPPTNKAGKEANAMPVFSFVAQLIESLKEYVRAQFRHSWAEYLICQRKPQTAALVRSWTFHSRHSLQAQLLASLLLINDAKRCRLYLRLRKYILQLANVAALDEIALRHEDAITVVHRMFPPAVKREIMNGLKQIFIAYKVAEAKIYACVFVQYILSIYDSIDQSQQSFMVGDTKLSSNIAISNFSTITKFNSNLHKDNGLYRKLQNSENSYTIIQTKFLPQKLERQKTKFQQQPNGNQYYSNSINFSEESMQSNVMRQQTEKENRRQNQSSFIKDKQSNLKIMIEDPHEQRAQIKIQDDSLESREYFNTTSKNSSIKSVHKQIQTLILRNEQFKSRLLSGKSSIKLQLSHQEQDSISETINIIHNSIVRNRRDRAA